MDFDWTNTMVKAQMYNIMVLGRESPYEYSIHFLASIY